MARWIGPHEPHPPDPNDIISQTSLELGPNFPNLPSTLESESVGIAEQVTVIGAGENEVMQDGQRLDTKSD